MVRNYWTLFYVSLIGAVVCSGFLISIVIFAKKIFLNKKYGIISLIFFVAFMIFIIFLCVDQFILCCKDFNLVINDTYFEYEATVVEFTHVQRDLDGNGEIRYRKPKFYIQEKDEYVVLNVKDVILGETYIIKYYPYTKIGHVEKIEMP